MMRPNIFLNIKLFLQMYARRPVVTERLLVHVTCTSFVTHTDRALLFGGVFDTEGPRYEPCMRRCKMKTKRVYIVILSTLNMLSDTQSQARFLMTSMHSIWREGRYIYRVS